MDYIKILILINIALLDISYDGLVTFEYESEKYNWVSTSLYEEINEWENINKKELFKIILEYMITDAESDL